MNNTVRYQFVHLAFVTECTFLLRLERSQASEEQQLPRQLHQQLLTAVYQCPASFVEKELPLLVDLLESAHAGSELTHDGTHLSVAVCRAFGISCPVSCCMLPGIPFLLVLQGISLRDPGESLIMYCVRQALFLHGQRRDVSVLCALLLLRSAMC